MTTGTNLVYVLTRGMTAFPTTQYGGGPAQTYDRGAIIITDPSFPQNGAMHFIKFTLETPSVSLTPSPIGSTALAVPFAAVVPKP